MNACLNVKIQIQTTKSDERSHPLKNEHIIPCLRRFRVNNIRGGPHLNYECAGEWSSAFKGACFFKGGAYGFDTMQARGLDGSGQTIVIVDGYGSPTLQEDLAGFDKMFHLPDAELTVYQPDGAVTGPWNADQQAWAKESALDVEMAHVVAPKAKIALVGVTTDSDDDAINGLSYAIMNHLGDVISYSRGWPESMEAPGKLAFQEQIFQAAVTLGISVQAASGDNGDYFSTYGYSDVSYPASSPYVTGVGGTSLGLKPDGSILFQTGWGTNQAQLSSDATTPLDPPKSTDVFGDSASFVMGAGGGTSRIFAQPRFQRKMKNPKRMVPDISYLADSYTGVQILVTQFDKDGNPDHGNQIIRVQGGTSLSSPMFSAVWAMANQRAGHSLGLAAAKLYRLPEGAIHDVLPISDELAANNVSGSEQDAANGTSQYSSLQLVSPQSSSSFLSTLFFSPAYHQPAASASWYVLTFGTDSSLSTTVGWDNVTGLGTPNGEKFIDEAAALR